MDHKEDFAQFLENNLNPQQKEAVTHTTGPLLVIAGAGSGKTRIITSRIAHLLLNESVSPSHIVALTFTNKAAREMQERIRQFINSMLPLPFVGTFHSYCLKLLKQQGKQFTIMDAADQEKLLQQLIKKHALQKRLSARNLGYHISEVKNCHAIGKTHPAFAYDTVLQELYHAYENEKTYSKCLDFDDLIVEALKLFDDEIFKKNFHQQTTHILVDEYQDTNLIQHVLLKKMSLEDKKLQAKSVCAVGDEDQSIYSWRGATVDNILQFSSDFPKTKTIKVEQNYRSVTPILETANHVIKHNGNRNPKKLWSAREGKNRVLLISTASGMQEATTAATFVYEQQKAPTQKTMAILYRTHYQSRLIEEALLKDAIPYTIIGGIQFYDRKEVKDLLAYAKLLVNPHDRISCARALNCPPRKLGEKSAELFFSTWEAEPFLTVQQVAQKLINDNIFTPAKAAPLQQFVTVLQTIDVNEKPSSIMQTLVEQLDYFTYLQDTYEPNDALTKQDNVKELIRAASHFENNEEPSIHAFLDNIALMQEKIEEAKQKESAVQLMTLHAAKGLEFDIVVITGLEEGVLPSSRSLQNEEALEEERRLFYVGITRAREYLVMLHCKYRNTYGQLNEQISSRFCNELPAQHCTTVDASYAHSTDIYSLVSAFMRQAPIIPLNHNVPPKSLPNKTKPATKTALFGATQKTQPWYVNQPVQHKTFGVGLVKKVEQRGEEYFLTILFRTTTKKIASKFISAV